MVQCAEKLERKKNKIVNALCTSLLATAAIPMLIISGKLEIRSMTYRPKKEFGSIQKERICIWPLLPNAMALDWK